MNKNKLFIESKMLIYTVINKLVNSTKKSYNI